jgi:hypothetical protein
MTLISTGHAAKPTFSGTRRNALAAPSSKVLRPFQAISSIRWANSYPPCFAQAKMFHFRFRFRNAIARGHESAVASALCPIS